MWAEGRSSSFEDWAQIVILKVPCSLWRTGVKSTLTNICSAFSRDTRFFAPNTRPNVFPSKLKKVPVLQQLCKRLLAFSPAHRAPKAGESSFHASALCDHWPGFSGVCQNRQGSNPRSCSQFGSFGRVHTDRLFLVRGQRVRKANVCADQP